ncbi:MAG: DUF4349 domain-containing protein [Oscillospiraceae bacterium]|jgi:hypothetical protein|nr:DUF4349 domain-containing protein [Oscillospiraceae bacterium]
MKHRKTGTLLLLCLLTLALLLSACGAQNKTADYESTIMAEDAVPREADALLDAGLTKAAEDSSASAAKSGANEAERATAGRKLIKDVDANLETEKFNECLKGLEAKAIALGGHVSSKNTNNGSYNWEQHRSATLVLRIPADKLDAFEKALEEKAHVIDISETVRDVTMQYTDVAAHIKAMTTERETLLQLLESAKSTEEVLQVRQQLTQVRYELDSLEGQMRLLEDQIALSTVTLNITEERRVKPEKRGFWAGVGDIFDRSLEFFYDLAQNLLGGVLYLLLLAAAVAALILLIRGRRRKKAARRAQG